MESLEYLLRDALVQWLAARAWPEPLHVASFAPEPGDHPPLPTLACWLERTALARPSPSTLPDGVVDWGLAEATVAFLFRCTSQAQADAFVRAWRDCVWMDVLAASPTGASPILPFQFTLGTTSWLAKLYLDGDFEFAPFEDTQVRGLWLVRTQAHLVYPALAFASPDHLLDVTLAVGNHDFPLGAYRTPAVTTTYPEPDGDLPTHAAVRITFDQPMHAPSLTSAVWHAREVPDSNASAFDITRAGGWALGLNTLTLPLTVRSLQGACLGAHFSLSFQGVPS